ncbi:MAG TPA: porin family protein [Parafilimonas sp.]|nr:porin family protein [Parafilimonas sp.]
MKKIIFFLLITTTFAAVSNAQSFHIGAKLGANLGKIDGESFKQEYNLSYLVGAYADLGIGKSWGIEPELIFSQTNATIDSGWKSIYSNAPGSVFGSKAHFNYLSVPILLNLNAGKLLTFQLGPQFSVLLNKDDKLTTNVGNAVKSGDLAAVLGARVNLGALNVFGRYNIGLSKINDIGDQQKWKNEAIQLGIGLRIL